MNPANALRLAVYEQVLRFHADTHVLRVNLPMPSKKNLLRRRRKPTVMPNNRRWIGMYRDPEVADAINALTLDLQRQWGAKPPLDSPYIHITLIAPTARQDADNIKTTLLDCLVKAGVLVGDNIKRLPWQGIHASKGDAWAAEIRLVGGTAK